MSNFIQEVLGLIQRKQIKTTLKPKHDWLEFGRLTSSTLNTGASYNPKMQPYTIKYEDFFCDVRQDLTVTIAGSGVAGRLPVYTVKNGICSLDALKDSIVSQDAADTSITVNGNLVVTEDSRLAGRVELGTLGDVVRSTSLFNVIRDSTGTAAGAANRILRSLADGRVVWSDDDPVVALTYGSIWRGSSTDVKEELAIGAAGQVLTSDGTTANWSSAGTGTVTSVGFVAPSAFTVAGSPITSSGVITLSGAGTAAEYIDGTGALQTFPSIPSAVPVMTSTVTGTGKLWSDVVQVEIAEPVTATPNRTYGVQFNDAQQLVVNIPWVSGGGGTTYTLTSAQSGTDAILTLTGSGGTTNDIRFVAGTNITLSDAGNSITIDAATPVIPFTSLTTNGGSGAATLTGGVLNIPIYTGGGGGSVTSVSASVGGNAINAAVTNPTSTPAIALTFQGASTDYIDGEGNFIPFPSVGGGTVTAVTGVSPIVSSGGTTPAISIIDFVGAQNLVNGARGAVPQPLQGDDQFRFLKGDGTWADTVTTITTSFPSPANQAMILSQTNPSGPTSQLNFTAQGTTAQYVDGTFALQTFPTIPAAYDSWNLTGDLGSAQAITNTNTVLIAGGVGLTSTASATDTLTIDLDDTAVTPGAYTNANLTVDQQGRITAVANGSAGSSYDWSLFADTGDIDPVGTGDQVTIAGGTNVTTALSGNTLTINATTSAPAGANGDVQYNNSGAFGAEANFNWNAASNFLTLKGSTNAPALKLENSTPSLFDGSEIAELIARSSVFSADIAGILFKGDGASGGGDYPTRIEFTTTPDGSTAPTTKLEIKNDGELIANQYGSGTFTGTAAKMLAVTSSGNVIEEDVVAPVVRPGAATSLTYDQYFNISTYSVTTVANAALTNPPIGGICVQHTGTPTISNVEGLRVNVLDSGSTSRQTIFDNISVGALIVLQNSTPWTATFIVRQLTVVAGGYVDIEVDSVAPNANTITTGSLLSFEVDSDYVETLTALYNRYDVDRTASSGTKNNLFLTPPSNYIAGTEVIVEIRGVAGSDPFQIGYLQQERISNGTDTIQNLAWQVLNGTPNTDPVGNNQTYLLKFVVYNNGTFKGLSMMSCDNVVRV